MADDRDFAARVDGDLVAAIVDRQPSALEEVYRRHSAPVLGVARRLVLDPALAEEVLQEVFLRLWRQPERFDATRGSLRTYLLIEANGRAIELVRGESARRGREDRHARLASQPDLDVEREVWEGVLAEHVRDALDSLSEGERAAIELAYFAGYTYRQVAVVLNEPEGTVKSRIRSGLMRLRDRLLAVDIGDVP
jgi:RNA polymerase sigma-70 factor (ECF subfamily)